MTHITDENTMPMPQKINVKKALAMHLKGRSYAEIGRTQGVAKQTVHAALKPILKPLPKVDDIESIRVTLADHFLVEAYRTVTSISDEDRERATLQQKATAAGIMLDKQRLMTGQTTSNQGLAVFFKAVMDSVPAKGDE